MLLATLSYHLLILPTSANLQEVGPPIPAHLAPQPEPKVQTQKPKKTKPRSTFEEVLQDPAKFGFQDFKVQKTGRWAYPRELEADQVVFEGDIPEQLLRNYVRVHSGFADDAVVIGQKVIDTAKCFHLDRYVFLNLVRRESDFDPTTYGENGVGLTQMTRVGLKEVFDQLGKRGRDHGNFKATRFYLSAIHECLLERLGVETWEPVWLRPEFKGSKVNKGIPPWMAYRKKMLDEDDALIHGAILLKTLVANFSHNRKETPLEEIYWDALYHYNGNKHHQEAYANTIMEWAGDLHKKAHPNAHQQDSI